MTRDKAKRFRTESGTVARGPPLSNETRVVRAELNAVNGEQLSVAAVGQRWREKRLEKRTCMIPHQKINDIAIWADRPWATAAVDTCNATA